MYHYVEDKEYLSRVRALCGEIMQDLCHTLKEEYDIGSVAYLVGSGARNLITQNENEPIDLDYNLEIKRCDDFGNPKAIKESVRKAFNAVLHQHGWGDCQNSRSALTTEQRYFKSGNPTEFSIDVCIVAKDDSGNIHRLVIEKTGFVDMDRCHWDMAPNSKDIRKKADYIKDQSAWGLVRDQYLQIKNHYLRRNDHNHPSFVCYIEAVNNVYNGRIHLLGNQYRQGNCRKSAIPPGLHTYEGYRLPRNPPFDRRQ